jgi:cell pole-organizing protein PopZ
MVPKGSSQLREAGLRKLVLARRWVVAASVTLTGVLTAIAAHAFPGKTIKPSSAHTATESSPSTRQQQSTESSQSSSSLKPPAEAPQSGATQESAPAQEPAPVEQSEPAQPTPETPVVSGGS